MEDKTEQEGGKRAWKCGNVGEDAGENKSEKDCDV